MSFTELGLHPTLLSRLEQLGYTQPAPAHTQLLPPMLEKADALVVGRAGTGCTEAALFALLHRCLELPDSHAAYIILTPSDSHTARTLQRIQAVAGNALSVNIISDSDPTPPPEIMAPLITITTAHHFLAKLRESDPLQPTPNALLLTEADEMIARGAKTALLELGNLLSTKPQVLICTDRATRSVTRVSNALQHQPERHTIKPDGEIPASIPQQAWPVPEHLKTNLLMKLHRRSHPASMLVLAANEDTAASVARRLRTAKSSSAALLYSDSAERQNSLRTRFEATEINVLLLTGEIPTNLLVEEVTHVVHYDLPADIRVYFHTLRRVPHAVHLNLVAPREEERVLEIEDGLGRPLFRDTLSDFDYTKPVPKRQSTPRRGKKARPPSDRRKPRTKKTEWDPEIPRTWGDRNAPIKDPDKIPLAEWSPEPLPAIWSKQKNGPRSPAPKQPAGPRPPSRKRGRRRSGNRKQ